MVKKGLIDASMDEDKLQSFINSEVELNDADLGPMEPNQDKRVLVSMHKKSVKTPQKECHHTKSGRDSISSDSEITIYKRAVKQIDLNLNSRIEALLLQSWKEIEKEGDRNR